MSFLLGAAFGLMGYCVGKIVELALAPRQAIVQRALREYIRNHGPR